MVSNPQMQALIERNPELGHLLNDPALLRQVLIPFGAFGFRLPPFHKEIFPTVPRDGQEPEHDEGDAAWKRQGYAEH